MSEPRRIEDVRDLVALLRLQVIKEDEFSARRGEPAPDHEVGQGVRFEVGVSDEHRLLTEFAFRFVADDCTIESEFTAIWAATEAICVSGGAMAEFIERVAMMAVIPYHREALATYATRLHVPVPTIGLVRQGEIDLEINVESLDLFLQDKVLTSVDYSE